MLSAKLQKPEALPSEKNIEDNEEFEPLVLILDNIKIPDEVKSEVYQIHNDINGITTMIDEYLEGVRYLWLENVKPYVNSRDCSTF